MSGKYENARLLLTPVDNLERSELFFKIMYELKDGNWVLREDSDPTRNNFLMGTGAGWTDTNAVANKNEIQKFRQDAFNNQTAGPLNAFQQQRIRDKVTALRVEATAESRAWLNLYDTRFTFTDGAGNIIRAARTEAMTANVTVTQSANSPIFGQLQENGNDIAGLLDINVNDGSAIDATQFSWNIGQYFTRAFMPKGPATKGGSLPLKFMLNKQNNTFNTYPFLLNL